MGSFEALAEAIDARAAEWDAQASEDLSLSYHANELGGEVGELMEALDLCNIMRQVGVASGKAQNLVKKLERDRYGMAGGKSATVDEVGDELADVVICAVKLALRAKIPNFGRRIIDKFNATSRKYGLKTAMTGTPLEDAAAMLRQSGYELVSKDRIKRISVSRGFDKFDMENMSSDIARDAMIKNAHDAMACDLGCIAFRHATLTDRAGPDRLIKTHEAEVTLILPQPDYAKKESHS